MFLRLFIFFTLFPIIELIILIKIGGIIGFLNTIILIIITALAGSYLVRAEGLNVYYNFQENLRNGKFPAEELFDGILILISGALLITPGILTDVIGFLFVFPFSRKIIKGWVKSFFKNKKDSGFIDVDFREL